MIKTYSELIKFNTFDARYDYLDIPENVIGEDTFGNQFRYLNQKFYTSMQWRKIRDYCIIRDKACDLAVPGLDIFGMIVIHHMNPIRPEDLLKKPEEVLDPEFLITTSDRTHRGFHYKRGNPYLNTDSWHERTPNDTCPWRK